MHIVAPADAYLPTSQSSHIPLALTYFPAPHCRQEPAPTSEDCPVGHAVHLSLPAPDAKVLTGHCVHVVRPAVLEIDPSAHVWHVDDFDPEILPAGQDVHVEEPSVE